MNVFSSLPAWPRYLGAAGEKITGSRWGSHRGAPFRSPRCHWETRTASKQKCPLFSQYADPVTDLLDRCGVFRARLFRESCVFHQGCYVKDLSRLGRDLRKTLILDNSPASYIFHPENAVSGSHVPTLGDWKSPCHRGRASGRGNQRSTPPQVDPASLWLWGKGRKN